MDYASTIKSMISTPELFSFYGFQRNRSGFICCPFHGEKTPSMKVYDGDGGYHCFGGCGAHGDALDFVRRYFSLSFKDAISKVNHDFGLGLPIGRESKEEQSKALAEIKARRMQAMAVNEEYESLKNAYYNALYEWIRLDSQRMKNAPQSIFEPLDDAFIEYLSKIEESRYRLDVAEHNLLKFELNRKEKERRRYGDK